MFSQRRRACVAREVEATQLHQQTAAVSALLVLNYEVLSYCIILIYDTACLRYDLIGSELSHTPDRDLYFRIMGMYIL